MANILARLFKRPERKYDSLDLFRDLYGGTEAWTGTAVTLQNAMQVSTALACGRVISEGIAMLPWKVLKRGTNRRISTAHWHPLYDKLAVGPNPLQTGYEFQETLGLHLAFCGNAYVYAPKVSGQVDYMYLLEPRWVTVEYEWGKAPRYKVQFDSGKATVLRPDNLWHVRGPSWTGYTGMEFLTLARQALGLSMAIEEGQARLQSQGVKLPGFLSVDGALTSEQHKKLQAWIEAEHVGQANAGRPMILDRASKWVATAQSNAEAQVMDQRRMQIEEVCRFMRVLPIMVGHADKTATYASAEQMFLAHAIYTLGPWARRLEQSADKFLLTEDDRSKGYYTKLNEKALQRMTARDQMEYLARGTQAGIITRNEAREKLDLNPLEGLDLPLAPLYMTTTNPPDPSVHGVGNGQPTGDEPAGSGDEPTNTDTQEQDDGA